MISPLDSHYTGVFVAGPDHTIVSPTAEFTRRLLRRRILAAGAAGTGKAAGAWSPIVALHDAYSTGIEWHRYRSAWLGFRLPLTPPLPLTRYRSSPNPSPNQAPQQAVLTRTLIRSRGAWRVTDETLPIWAESDWPAGVTASLWPASPSLAEGALLLGLGLLSGLLTLGAVRGARHTYGTATPRSAAG